MEDKHSESGLTKGSTGDEICMHYYEESFLSEVLADRYFEVVYSERIKSVASDDTDTTDLILVSRKIRWYYFFAIRIVIDFPSLDVTLRK